MIIDAATVVVLLHDDGVTLLDAKNQRYRPLRMEMVNKQNGRRSIFASEKVAFTPDSKDLVGDLGEFKPTFILSVPRVFEKVYNSAEQKAASSAVRRRLFRWAAKTSIVWSRALDTLGGPTTAARMDSYMEAFLGAGAWPISLGKGNRGAEVAEACRRHGGFYLGTIGGAAAPIAQDHIRSVDLLDLEELGMEAVRRIEVIDLPAFIVIDDKGQDFYRTFR